MSKGFLGEIMKKIPLTCDKFALIDDEDFERVNQYKWYAKRPKNKNGIWYASGCVNGETISMHRFILGLKKGDGQITDHIDDNGLNNQKSNLRKCTAQQNRQNARKRRNICSSKYLGVWYFAPDSAILNEEIPKIQWRAQICVNGKLKHLGTFNSEEQAALAYDLAAKKHFGEFARLNFF